MTLFDYVFVSVEEDSDESKVLCKIKTKSSDLSLLLSWKWCETDNNRKITIEHFQTQHNLTQLAQLFLHVEA